MRVRERERNIDREKMILLGRRLGVWDRQALQEVFHSRLITQVVRSRENHGERRIRVLRTRVELTDPVVS